MSNNQTSSGGIGLGGILFVLFLTLKLCGVIDWSWWWVTAPLWIPLGLWLFFALAILVIALVISD